MTFLRSERLHRATALLLAALLAVSLVGVLCLPADAVLSCDHQGTEKNGFCSADDCGGCEIPVQNGEVYEIANAGQLYYFMDVILQQKAPEDVVRAKLTAHIVLIEDLLDDEGEVNTQHLKDGTLRASLPTWQFSAPVCGVELDGDGYTVSGLYGVSGQGEPVGLFGKAENVTVKNLGVLDSYFHSFGYVGALIGEALGGCVVENCFVLESKLMGPLSAGLVGRIGFAAAQSAVKNCYTDAPAALAECGEQSEITGCFYLAESESDAILDTAHKTAAQMMDGTLLDELNATGVQWVESCAREVPMLRADHAYEYACSSACLVCGTERTDSAHAYTNKCEERCTYCGAYRVLESYDHYYRGTCDATCDECGYERVATGAHQYSNKCDEYCDNCLFQRDAAEDHVYSSACDKFCDQCRSPREDAADHTYAKKTCDMLVCSGCGATRPSGENHTFDNACDTTCNDCDVTRETTHAYGDFVVVSEATHFSEGAKERVCSVCGHTDTLVIEQLPGWPVWLILTVSLGGAAVLGGGLALYLLVFKKKH